jgi:hypothetical protein
MSRINSYIKNLTPPTLSYKIISWKKLLSPSYVTSESIKLNELKSMRRNEDCYILGTGPSLRKVCLLSLRKGDFFFTGEAFLHRDSGRIGGQFYVLGTNHPPYEARYVKDLVNKLMAMPKDTTFIFGHTNYSHSFGDHLFGRDKMSFDRRKYLINYSGASDLDEYNYKDCNVYDVSRNPFNPRTVIFSALQCAIFMGYRKIYLFGCEHDYLLRYFNSDFSSHHFYQDSNSLLPNVPDYLSEFTLLQWFEEYYKRWKAYDYLKRYANQKGIEIINSTDGGILDIFPRVSFEELSDSKGALDANEA